MKMIEKNTLLREIKVLQDTATDLYGCSQFDTAYKNVIRAIENIEVKEVNLEKGSLTWEDIREIYIIFAEIDAEIEFCKTNIQVETIGYYQEVLKRYNRIKDNNDDNRGNAKTN